MMHIFLFNVAFQVQELFPAKQLAIGTRGHMNLVHPLLTHSIKIQCLGHKVYKLQT